MDGLSTADVLAMTKDNGGFLEGNGIIILLLFLLFLGGGFGLGGNASAMNGAMTRAEMQDGFNNQNTVNSLNNLMVGMNNGFNSVTLGMTNGFNGVQSSIANLGFNMQNCCCDIKQQIQLQGDLTRSLINSNTMQDLRDKIAEKDRAIQTAQFDASQVGQTAQIEAFILANK